MNKNTLALTAVALSAVATASAVSQEDITTLRAYVDVAEYTEADAPAALTQRVEGLSGQTRAFNAPSMEQFEEHLLLLEREYALEQEELRAVRLKEVAQQEAADVAQSAALVHLQQEEVARTRQVQLNELLEEQMAAEVALAAQTRDMLEHAGIKIESADESVGLLRALYNRIASLAR